MNDTLVAARKACDALYDQITYLIEAFSLTADDPAPYEAFITRWNGTLDIYQDMLDRKSGTSSSSGGSGGNSGGGGGTTPENPDTPGGGGDTPDNPDNPGGDTPGGGGDTPGGGGDPDDPEPGDDQD
jgi:hypothetical protein